MDLKTHRRFLAALLHIGATSYILKNGMGPLRNIWRDASWWFWELVIALVAGASCLIFASGGWKLAVLAPLGWIAYQANEEVTKMSFRRFYHGFVEFHKDGGDGIDSLSNQRWATARWVAAERKNWLRRWIVVATTPAAPEQYMPLSEFRTEVTKRLSLYMRLRKDEIFCDMVDVMKVCVAIFAATPVTTILFAGTMICSGGKTMAFGVTWAVVLAAAAIVYLTIKRAATVRRRKLEDTP